MLKHQRKIRKRGQTRVSHYSSWWRLPVVPQIPFHFGPRVTPSPRGRGPSEAVASLLACTLAELRGSCRIFSFSPAHFSRPEHSDSPVSLSFPEFRLPFRSCDDSAAECRWLMKFTLCSLQSLGAYEPRPWPIFGIADLWAVPACTLSSLVYSRPPHAPAEGISCCGLTSIHSILW